MELSKAFALVVPNVETMKIKDEAGFFQAVKARLVKYEPRGEDITKKVLNFIQKG